MHQKCVICEAWNQSKYLIWATFVKQLSSSCGLSRLFRTLVCKNCSNEPRLTQYFYPLGNFGASSASPQPRISHSELHVPTPLLLVPLSGRSLELHFVRHEPVPSLQFRAPFGYLNLITNSIFGPACQPRFFQSYLATELQGQNYKVCGWDRHFQTYSIFFFIYLREVPNFRPNPPTPDIWNSLITFRVVWDLGNGNPFPGWGDFGKSLVGYKNWSLKSILMGIQ